MSVRPTVLEVSKSALEHNYRAIEAEALNGGARPIFVVKADGYGLGAVQMATWAWEWGADFFGVATPDEALELREAGFVQPILVLGASPYDAAELYVERDIRPAVTDLAFVERLSKAATKMGKTVKVHIKMDSGMGRIGFLRDELLAVVDVVAASPGVEIEGMFTHFSTSDEADLTWTHEQFKTFSATVTDVRAKGIEPGIIHCCNSGALMAGLRGYYCDRVRPGHIIYGLLPSGECGDAIEIVRPFTLKTRVALVRDVPEGWGISYGRTYRAKVGERTAVLPIGYADGFPRALSNKGEALIRGRRCPILGRICMDQMVVGVGHVEDVATGDEAVLIGAQGGEELSILEVAGQAGTITGALPTSLTPRVPRVYVD
ncbi:MAG: alanine racemase [Synergistaceae bacterium]|nr:alanine racemase [Synergistaceae bacterium]